MNPSTLHTIVPRLPMIDLAATQAYYRDVLGFTIEAVYEHEGYLITSRGAIEIHLFRHSDLLPADNYAQCYVRVSHIAALYQEYLAAGADIPALGHLADKPWGQCEFAVRDNNANLLTFGEAIYGE